MQIWRRGQLSILAVGEGVIYAAVSAVARYLLSRSICAPLSSAQHFACGAIFYNWSIRQNATCTSPELMRLEPEGGRQKERMHCYVHRSGHLLSLSLYRASFSLFFLLMV